MNIIEKLKKRLDKMSEDLYNIQNGQQKASNDTYILSLEYYMGSWKITATLKENPEVFQSQLFNNYADALIEFKHLVEQYNLKIDRE